MSEIKDGGPAFPRPASTDEHSLPCNVYQDQMGMSLRDYFAGQALAGLCAKNGGRWDNAESAYMCADAMIAQRDKEGAS